MRKKILHYFHKINRKVLQAVRALYWISTAYMVIAILAIVVGVEGGFNSLTGMLTATLISIVCAFSIEIATSEQRLAVLYKRIKCMEDDARNKGKGKSKK